MLLTSRAAGGDDEGGLDGRHALPLAASHHDIKECAIPGGKEERGSVCASLSDAIILYVVKVLNFALFLGAASRRTDGAV